MELNSRARVCSFVFDDDDDVEFNGLISDWEWNYNAVDELFTSECVAAWLYVHFRVIGWERVYVYDGVEENSYKVRKAKFKYI